MICSTCAAALIDTVVPTPLCRACAIEFYTELVRAGAEAAITAKLNAIDPPCIPFPLEFTSRPLRVHIDPVIARDIRERRARGERRHVVAGRYGCSVSTVTKIEIGDIWRDAGGPIRPRQAWNRRRLTPAAALAIC